ncbi:MAG: lipoyl synthase [Candidatus Omnitrophota bacterium]|nr:lipoyl synthase [Candidatus Omnitrophota bacterium]MBU1929058.1 lipoyl synthase [Candidatus Omnitrophota bacterium]
MSYVNTPKKPYWLNKKINKDCSGQVQDILSELSINTVCREAMCPNIHECFARNTATFLILGDICTRQCRFCAVKKGIPAPVDRSEPERIAQAVKRMGIRYVVVTSVTRDDLADAGAGIFVKTISAIRSENPRTNIEVLIPDFKADTECLKKIIQAKPQVISHNLETIPNFYKEVRQGSDYHRSLSVLDTIKKLSDIHTKSGLMLGLGESGQEVLGVLRDLRAVGCDFLSLGQYLAPSLKHYPVKEYVAPEKFNFFKEEALKLGFLYVASNPYVRSSYMAEEYLIKGVH